VYLVKHNYLILVFILCVLLYVHERPTNALILLKVFPPSYLLLHVSASSMPSSESLNMPTDSEGTSNSVQIFFYVI
jgi:hypothetical protein